MRWLLTRTLQIGGGGLVLLLLSRFMFDRTQDYVLQIILLCGVFVTLAVSLNLINGVTGQFSIGHAGFFGVGAYVGASWTKIWLPRLTLSDNVLALGTVGGDAMNLLIAIILAALVAAIAGLVVGLPSLRLRGDYLAIVTLGFGEVIKVCILNIDAVGGARGFNGIPTLTNSGGLSVFWVWGLAILCIALSRNLLQSVRGLTFLAVREDEIAADAMGVNTTKVKVTAFVIGAAFAGAAGAIYAHFLTFINTDNFAMDVSIIITTMVVMGGTGSITGSALAAILLTALPETLRFMKDYRMVIFSTLLVIMMLTRPQGILGHREIGLGTFFKKYRRRPTEASP